MAKQNDCFILQMSENVLRCLEDHLTIIDKWLLSQTCQKFRSRQNLTKDFPHLFVNKAGLRLTQRDPFKGPSLDLYTLRDLQLVLRKDMYCDECLTRDWSKNNNTLHQPSFSWCSGCKLAHVGHLFTKDQIQKPSVQRLCIGWTELLHLCAHKTIAYEHIKACSNIKGNQTVSEYAKTECPCPRPDRLDERVIRIDPDAKLSWWQVFTEPGFNIRKSERLCRWKEPSEYGLIIFRTSLVQLRSRKFPHLCQHLTSKYGGLAINEMGLCDYLQYKDDIFTRHCMDCATSFPSE